MLALTLDIMIVVLLLVSLGTGLRLHGALKIFRLEGNEFQPLVQSLDKATARAEAALGNLRKMAEDVGVKLNSDTKNTQRLLDELDFMTKRADQLAEKLDDSIGKARSVKVKEAIVDPASGSNPTPRSNDVDQLGIASNRSRRSVPELEQRLKNLR